MDKSRQDAFISALEKGLDGFVRADDPPKCPDCGSVRNILFYPCGDTNEWHCFDCGYKFESVAKHIDKDQSFIEEIK